MVSSKLAALGLLIAASSVLCLDSAFSGEPDVLTVSEIPSNLTARAASSTQIILEWQNNTSKAQWIEVQRRIADPREHLDMIAKLPARASKFMDMNLQPNTGYEYRVLAVNQHSAANSLVASAATSADGSTASNGPGACRDIPLHGTTGRYCVGTGWGNRDNGPVRNAGPVNTLDCINDGSCPTAREHPRNGPVNPLDCITNGSCSNRAPAGE